MAYDSGLIAYWKLNDATGTIASDTINGFSGGVSGATWTSGILASGLKFDGDDYVSVGSATAISVGSYFSISAWIFPRVWNNGGGTAIRLISKVDDANNHYLLTAVNAGIPGSDLPMFRVKRAGTIVATYNSATYLQAGSWHNIVGVYSGNITYLYVNGGSVGGEGDQGMGDGVAPHLYFGARNTVGPFLSGTMDDIRYYNYALSAAQVTDIYNGGAGSEYASGGGVTPSAFMSPRRFW